MNNFKATLTVFLTFTLFASAAVGQEYQRDVQVAANHVALNDTIRTMQGRGFFDKAAADKYIYAQSLSDMAQKYKKAGRADAFQKAVKQAAKPHSEALRAIYASKGPGKAPAGFPAPLPTPEAVLAVIEGSDALDTAARQGAAFKILRDAIEDLSGTMDILARPPGLAAYTRLYLIAEIHTQARMTPTFDPKCSGTTCDRYRFYTKMTEYEFDADFQREFLGKVLPANVVSSYIRTQAQHTAAYDARRKAERERAEQWQASVDRATGTTWGEIFENLGLGLLGIVLFVGFIALLIFSAKSNKAAPPPLTDNYGKAEFEGLRDKLPRADAFLRGVFLGKSSKSFFTQKPSPQLTYAPVFTEPEAHTLIVARTRTGKGTRVIVPTLLRYYGSVITIDPKGENAAITARARKMHLSQDVHIVNPWHELSHQFLHLGLAPPATYNPLDVLDRDNPNAVAIAQALASTVCPTVAGDKDRFWQGSAANVLAAVFLWLADHPREQKTLARAREIVSQSRKAFTDKYLVHMASSEAYGGAVREMVSQLIDMADETYSGVMSNLNEATKFLSDPQVKASTATSSFSMDDLVFGRTTVYLVLPPDRMDTQKTWLRLVLTAAMQTFKKHRFDPRRTGRCMFLIDEFAALGRMDDVPRDIATMSGYGLDFTLVVQGLDQLKSSYGESADTILNNCAWKWFCNISDLSTAKYVSESLGNKTVRTIGKSENQSSNQGGGSEGESTTYGETGRPLMRHEEILQLGREFAICFQPNGAPLFLQTIDYWNLKDAFAHMEATDPTMFWEPPLAYDDNPYV